MSNLLKKIINHLIVGSILTLMTLKLTLRSTVTLKIVKAAESLHLAKIVGKLFGKHLSLNIY